MHCTEAIPWNARVYYMYVLYSDVLITVKVVVIVNLQSQFNTVLC